MTRTNVLRRTLGGQQGLREGVHVPPQHSNGCPSDVREGTVAGSGGSLGAHDRAVVIKADGLAAGKGVVIYTHKKEAAKTLRDMLQNGKYGEAGERVVMESTCRAWR